MKASTKEVPGSLPNQVNQVVGQTFKWWQIAFPALILSCLSFAFYYPSVRYDFQFDDIINIQKFYSIRLNTLWSLFLGSSRWISYWINSIHYKIGKFDPYTYRLFNITAHTVTGMLVYFFIVSALSRLAKKSFLYENRLLIAIATAGLFLLHPVQTQTVSYVIQGQLEGLATLFTVAMCLVFILWNNASSIIVRTFLGVLLLTLGFISCGTKEIAIMSPFLVLLTDWFFVAQGNIKDLKSRWYIHGLLFAVVIGMYVYFLKPSFFTQALGLKIEARNNIGNILTERQTDPITPFHFFISQFKVILHYLMMFIWPFNISVEYDWKLVSSFFAPDCLMPLFILLIGAFFIFKLLQKDRTSIIAFAFLWFAISIAPRSSIIPSSELLSDYKTYLGSVGILLFLAIGLVAALNELIQKIESSSFRLPVRLNASLLSTFLIFSLLSPIGFLTYHRNKVWRSAEEFWTNVIENAPLKARAYNNLGVALSEKGKMQESIPYYKRAIKMDANYPDPWNNLAVAYSATGKIDMAIDTMKQALVIHRNYPEGYNNLASFLISKKDYENAEKMLQTAIVLRPYYGKAYFNMGKMYMDQGKHDLALQAFRDACTKADLDNVPGFTVLGTMAMAMNKYEDAIFAYRKLLEFEPYSFEHAFNLAHSHALNNQFSEAITVYKQLTKRFPNDGRAWFNLAECYMRIKQTENGLDALVMAQRLGFQATNLELRIANALRELGRYTEAYQTLQLYSTKESAPENYRQAARIAMSEMVREGQIKA